MFCSVLIIWYKIIWLDNLCLIVFFLPGNALVCHIWAFRSEENFSVWWRHEYCVRIFQLGVLNNSLINAKSRDTCMFLHFSFMYIRFLNIETNAHVRIMFPDCDTNNECRATVLLDNKSNLCLVFLCSTLTLIGA